MVHELYNILSIFVTSGLFLGLGLVLLFSGVPGSPLLGNYHKARYMLSVAYLFLACVNIAEYFMGGSPDPDVRLLRTMTLAIGASQAFLFGLAILALLEVRFPGWRSIFREAAPVLGFIAAVFGVYAFCPEACFNVAFWGFAGLYALLVARYSYLIIRNYRRFRRRMDNYFSGNEADRLRWVLFSFSAAFAIGVGALLTSVFMSIGAALIFTVAFDIFYTYFAIRFINYTYRFHMIEAAMESDAPEHAAQQQHDKNALPRAIVKTIETGLRIWKDEKRFLQPGVTIGDVSHYVGTNDKYLSLYINKYMGRTFREWIGSLRIEEAKRLMRDDPDMPLAEIASRTGFATKSHFGQQFRSLTGFTPSVWRQQASRQR